MLNVCFGVALVVVFSDNSSLSSKWSTDMLKFDSKCLNLGLTLRVERNRTPWEKQTERNSSERNRRGRSYFSCRERNEKPNANSRFTRRPGHFARKPSLFVILIVLAIPLKRWHDWPLNLGVLLLPAHSNPQFSHREHWSRKQRIDWMMADKQHQAMWLFWGLMW